MLHLVLHDVLEAFGLYLQQPFLKQVRREDGASSSVSPVPGDKGRLPALSDRNLRVSGLMAWSCL
jgi:hypothetical protein